MEINEVKIGDSFIGFKFPEHHSPGFVDEMQKLVGKTGEVVDVDYDMEPPRALVHFASGDQWWYPLDKYYKNSLQPVKEAPQEVEDTKNLKDQFSIESLKIAAYAVVDIRDNSCLALEHNRHSARIALRDAKEIWPEYAKSFKIVKLKADKFVR